MCSPLFLLMVRCLALCTAAVLKLMGGCTPMLTRLLTSRIWKGHLGFTGLRVVGIGQLAMLPQIEQIDLRLSL
jgi:hypothetical protein